MPAKIPNDKWSWKYQSCQICKTTSKEGRYKHEAKGLCQFCYKRQENEKKRKGRPVRNYKNYWQKIKNDPLKVTQHYKQLAVLRKKEDWYKIHLKKRWARIKYKQFIKDWFENREACKYGKKGMILNLEFDGEEYKIMTPLHPKHLENYHLDIFREEFEKYMKNRAVDNSPK